MLNYAYVNSLGRRSFVSDETYAFRGTWTGTALYNPPDDVADYNNARYIVLVQNINSPPPANSKWSEMVLIGTVNPTDPFNIADTALTTATGATVIANEAVFLANEALAYVHAGTTMGTTYAVPAGTNQIFINGVNGTMAFVPSSIVTTVQNPSGTNTPGFYSWLAGTATLNGFCVMLSGTVPGPGYLVDWIAHA
jgi:hypothetical protein